MIRPTFLTWFTNRPAWHMLGVMGLGLLGCEENYYITKAEPREPAGEGGQAGAAPDPVLEGAPEPDTKADDHAVDTFGPTPNRYWFAVAEEQVQAMNEYVGNGPGIPLFNVGDIYSPIGTPETFADHLFVTAAGKTANYGKTETRIIGQSTLRPWSARSLPNIRIDANAYDKKRRIGDVEHLRFNNGLVGSIFREHITLELYRRLGYPAPRSGFAWVGSNVWGPDIWVPYTVVEVYKKPLCKRFSDVLGGGCANMWEFFGDFGQGVVKNASSCQVDNCDNQRVSELEELVVSLPPGPGFKAALEEWVQWDNYHRFQCLSWILATGDDALHNQNNVLLVEQLDGRFSYLPYSVDISLGQDWYPEVALPGYNTISSGCQSDPDCWDDTIAACETAIDDFVSVDPLQVADDVFTYIANAAMLRDGDVSRFDNIRLWLEQRVENLSTELENYRELPEACAPPMILCNDLCVFPEECLAECEPIPEEQRQAAEAQAAAAGQMPRIANACLPVDNYQVQPK